MMAPTALYFIHSPCIKKLAAKFGTIEIPIYVILRWVRVGVAAGAEIALCSIVCTPAKPTATANLQKKLKFSDG